MEFRRCLVVIYGENVMSVQIMRKRDKNFNPFLEELGFDTLTAFLPKMSQDTVEFLNIR